MLTNPIIVAIKKTSKMIDMDSSHLKYVDYSISLKGQARLSFFILGLIWLAATISIEMNNCMIMAINSFVGSQELPVQNFQVPADCLNSMLLYTNPDQIFGTGTLDHCTFDQYYW